jgi:hypothetical protein
LKDYNGTSIHNRQEVITTVGVNVLAKVTGNQAQLYRSAFDVRGLTR